LLLEFTFQTGVSDGYPGIGCAAAGSARAKGEKDLCPRAPKLQKIIFIRPTTDHAEFSIMALR